MKKSGRHVVVDPSYLMEMPALSNYTLCSWRVFFMFLTHLKAPPLLYSFPYIFSFFSFFDLFELLCESNYRCTCVVFQHERGRFCLLWIYDSGPCYVYLICLNICLALQSQFPAMWSEAVFGDEKHSEMHVSHVQSVLLWDFSTIKNNFPYKTSPRCDRFNRLANVQIQLVAHLLL